MIEEFHEYDDNLFELYKSAYNYHLNNKEGFFKEKKDDELKEDFKEFLKKENNHILVYKDKRILGYLSFYVNKKSTFIEQLDIDEGARNRQIATKLIEKVYDFVKENDLKYVELNCWNFNENGKRLYEYLGFEPLRIVYRKEV